MEIQSYALQDAVTARLCGAACGMARHLSCEAYCPFLEKVGSKPLRSGAQSCHKVHHSVWQSHRSSIPTPMHADERHQVLTHIVMSPGSATHQIVTRL
jgi:hypothetical protein